MIDKQCHLLLQPCIWVRFHLSREGRYVEHHLSPACCWTWWTHNQNTCDSVNTNGIEFFVINTIIITPPFDRHGECKLAEFCPTSQSKFSAFFHQYPEIYYEQIFSENRKRPKLIFCNTKSGLNRLCFYSAHLTFACPCDHCSAVNTMRLRIQHFLHRRTVDKGHKTVRANQKGKKRTVSEICKQFK